MLKNKYLDTFDNNNPLKEYPRPQFRRDSYINLNGKWDFKITCIDKIPSNYNETIIVPYPVESYLSNINRRVSKDDILYYHKEFKLDKSFIKDKVILHVDACDEFTNIYLNNNLIATSYNGYLPIIVDITKYLKEDNNDLVIKVIDKLDNKYPYGKQKNKNGGMWYTPVSGIWQSVWLESVNDNYIKDIKIDIDFDNKKVLFKLDTSSSNNKITILSNDKVIDSKIGKLKFEFKLDKPVCWSPENPFLYDVIIENESDTVKSYFAFRSFKVNDKCFLLNNKPYYINGLLDQGYFVNGILTPSNYKEYEDDILTMKSLGFNTLRKHIKIEPLMFYHLCDKLGMIVFQDFVNNGKYSFLKDTAIPTIGFKKAIHLNLPIFDKKRKEIFKESSINTLKYLYNVPSILYYTIFNEGWGQHEANKYYKLVKSLDSSRVIDSTSGWFKDKLSDVNSLHVYFKPIRLHKSKKPIIVSEFGGYAFKVKDHVNDMNKYYGYKKLNSLEDLNNSLYDLFSKDIIANIDKGLAGSIYTQVSDVEDEVNGLFTYDRKVLKANVDTFKKIKENIDKKFKDKYGK